MKMVQFHRVIFLYKAIAFKLSKWASPHNLTVWDSVMTECHEREPKVERLAKPLS
jgi:hypothetical protein